MIKHNVLKEGSEPTWRMGGVGREGEAPDNFRAATCSANAVTIISKQQKLCFTECCRPQGPEYREAAAA